MTQVLTFTVKDICNALGGVNRSRVHGWMELPPFCLIHTSQRSARRLDVADMLTLAALHVLEDVYGLKASCLGRLSQGLHNYLAQPKVLGGSELVFVNLDGSRVHHVDSAPVAEPGWVLDVTDVRARINRFLGLEPAQRELTLVAVVQD